MPLAIINRLRYACTNQVARSGIVLSPRRVQPSDPIPCKNEIFHRNALPIAMGLDGLVLNAGKLGLGIKRKIDQGLVRGREGEKNHPSRFHVLSLARSPPIALLPYHVARPSPPRTVSRPLPFSRYNSGYYLQ